MGFMDEAKEKFEEAKDKVEDLIHGHEDQAGDAIDKGADIADDKTGGEHTQQIDQAAEKAKDALGATGEVAPGVPASPSVTSDPTGTDLPPTDPAAADQAPPTPPSS